jgi:sialic acid synthase
MRISKPVLIAEIGCNHLGDINVAKKLIDVAADFCNIKYVKFQKRNNKILFSKKEYKSAHPVPKNSYGKTYGEHRDFLEFNLRQHIYLAKYCKKKKIEYFSSVWDIISAKEICKINPSIIKIGSGTNLNFPVLNYLCNKFEGTIHLSLGMTSKEEEKEILNLFIKNRRNQDLVLYACTSDYPVQSKDACLLEIERLQKNYIQNKKIIRDVGFSGHHLGIALDIAAYVLGAKYIERHFTLDRTLKGTDHSASLEPDGLRKLSRNLNAVYLAMKYKDKDILNCEISSRKKLKKIIS